MNTHAGTGFTAVLVMLAGTFVLAQLVVAGPATVAPTEMTVASKRTKDLVITITSMDGRLKGGENSLCVLFQKRATQEAVDLQNVSIDFTLLVGRIQEEPIRAQLTKDQVGRYCGHVDLGKQYYVPASYYAFVRYTDGVGKKRRQRLFLSVK
jgi:hypothetical protein